MTPAMRGSLRQLLIKHEGYRLMPYTDTLGNTTIGIGRNLTGRGAQPTEIDQMFNNDVDYFYNFLTNTYPWFQLLNEARQIALVDMCFMGTKPFSEFENMIDYLSKANWLQASLEIKYSKYASQVGQRAIDIQNIILNGAL